MDLGSILAPKTDKKSDRFRDRFLNGSKIGFRSLAKRSLASQASPKDTILVSSWTPELESSGPEDQEPGTGTGAEDLTRLLGRRPGEFNRCRAFRRAGSHDVLSIVLDGIMSLVNLVCQIAD